MSVNWYTNYNRQESIYRQARPLQHNIERPSNPPGEKSMQTGKQPCQYRFFSITHPRTFWSVSCWNVTAGQAVQLAFTLEHDKYLAILDSHEIKASNSSIMQTAKHVRIDNLELISLIVSDWRLNEAPTKFSIWHRNIDVYWHRKHRSTTEFARRPFIPICQLTGAKLGHRKFTKFHQRYKETTGNLHGRAQVVRRSHHPIFRSIPPKRGAVGVSRR